MEESTQSLHSPTTKSPSGPSNRDFMRRTTDASLLFVPSSPSTRKNDSGRDHAVKLQIDAGVDGQGDEVPGNSPTQRNQPKYVCIVCEKTFTASKALVAVKQLKPRFVRLLAQNYPSKQFAVDGLICMKDVFGVINTRIDKLLEEDQDQYSQLQDDAMRNLLIYELEEETWQNKFESSRSIGEKAADGIAKFGGSWRFILTLLGILALWAVLNLSLPDNAAWDPYPFILLNLFLSSLAAFQAPIIMMSQNRQDQKDRIVNNYISKIILRSENQIRHANAKIDHFMNYQWKRLLEIQEIQISLLETFQKHSKSIATMQRGRGSHLPDSGVNGKVLGLWSCETQMDNHLRMLLMKYFYHEVNQIKDRRLSIAPHMTASFTDMNAGDDTMIFSRWHTDGDNFVGFAQNMKLEFKKGSQKLKKVVYELSFIGDALATLDDVFSGSEIVTLRNDFDLPHMKTTGRILHLTIHFANQTVQSCYNGDLPPRYKPTFHSSSRVNRISDFWKQPLHKITITYSPPYLVSVLELQKGQVVKGAEVHFFASTRNTTASLRKARLFARKDPAKAEEYLASVARALAVTAPSTGSPKDVEEIIKHYSTSPAWSILEKDGWEEVATCSWDTPQEFENVQQDLAPIAVEINQEFVGPGTWIFYCPDCRVTVHGDVEMISEEDELDQGESKGGNEIGESAAPELRRRAKSSTATSLTSDGTSITSLGTPNHLEMEAALELEMTEIKQS